MELAMDPSQLEAASLVIGALAAGTAEGLKDTAKRSVIAARDKMISLLRSRLRNDEDAAADFNVYLRRPTAENAESLVSHIIAAGLDRDEEILAAARSLLEVAGQTTTGAGSIAARSVKQVNLNGSTGFLGGQHVHYHDAGAPTLSADWELFHLRGSVFELRNVGTSAAYDVVLDASGAVRFDPPNEDLSVWPRGSGYEFFAVGSLQTGHPRLIVRWKNAPEQSAHQTWERPLPR